MYKKALRHPKSLTIDAWNIFIWLHIKAKIARLNRNDITTRKLLRKNITEFPPQLHVESPHDRYNYFDDGFCGVYQLLLVNLRSVNSLSRYRYALPSPAFNGIYLWDSALIAQIWKWWDSATALELLQAVVAVRDGDRLQHVVKKHAFSPLTQPPLVAWSLVHITRTHWDEEMKTQAEQLYPILANYHEWLYKNRRLSNGLFAWANPYESGIDNSPRFSSRDESSTITTTSLASPDFSSYIVLHCEALQELATLLGHTKDALAFAKQATEIRTAINNYLWHEEDGLYYDRDLTGAWRRTRTISSLIPLWAGVPSAAQAQRLRSHVMDPESFNTLVPLPSVALNDPAFELDMWRGPVWINTAYMVIEGLKQYGFLQEAAELAWRLVDGVYKVFETEGQIYEFYHPQAFEIRSLSRKRGNKLKRLTLGSSPQRNFVGWSGLVNNLLIETLIGFGYENGKRIIRPCFPKVAVGCSFQLSLPSEKLRIELRVLPGQAAKGTIIHGDKVHKFNGTFGEVIVIGR